MSFVAFHSRIEIDGKRLSPLAVIEPVVTVATLAT
jgi:hypothetical protein